MLNKTSILKSSTYVFFDDRRYSPKKIMPQKVLTNGSACQRRYTQNCRKHLDPNTKNDSDNVSLTNTVAPIRILHS